MNYLKLQTALMMELHNPKPRGPHICETPEGIFFVNAIGTAAYAIPKEYTYLDINRFNPITFNPFKKYKLEDCTPLTDTGLRKKDELKRTRYIFKRGEEAVHIDLKLIGYFSPDAKFYQKGATDAVIVTEPGVNQVETIVGYVFPIRLHEKDKKLN